MKRLLLLSLILLSNALYSQSTYVIPVVFHVLHQGSFENISDAQILDAMSIINEDFTKLNADTALIEPIFKPIAANADIEFRLATLDPSGNCTNGIDRISTVLCNNANDCSKLNQWDPAHYLNIWVVKSLENTGIAEYVYLPAAAADPDIQPYDGIMILQNYIGSIGTGWTATSRVLTRALGHYFGLNPMGTTCDDLDGIADTPPTDGTSVCGLDSTCNASVHENYQNFMSNYPYCICMFTNGQVNSMHACLNSSLANRDQLWTPANLLATGVTGSGAACPPKADFYAIRRFRCPGGLFQFLDCSFNGAPTSWNWVFAGPSGSIISTVQNPLLSFSNPGLYNVSLTVSNSSGSGIKTSMGYFKVANGTNDFYGPNTYEFENSTDFYNLFTGFNYEKNTSKWQHTDTCSYGGSACVMLNNFGICSKDQDDLITPSYDLSTTTFGTLKFRFSGAVTNASLSGGTLKVYVSKDCGQTWPMTVTWAGSTIAPAGVHSTYFVPSSPSDWTELSCIIPSVYNVPNVYFKFSYTQGEGGNNVYIDDLKVEGVLGVDESDSFREGNLFPNPSSGTFTYELELSNSEKGRMEIMDITGKIISVNELQTEKTMIDVSTYSEGIYFCKIYINNKETDHKKLILIK